VRAFFGFLIRLVAYALVLVAVSRMADALWVGYGLDGSIALQPFHDYGIEVLEIAPLPLALFGFGPFRQAAIFIAALVVGIALTAPFAVARFSGI
jgi:hypothetical protein